ncbi:Ser-Thr-rich glycosyl-phosphatidyl-inositol-anchored membrane family-domain-containing protein [Aspergillus filifer]
MRSMFFLALSAVATLAAARENPFNIPSEGYSFTAGESTTLSWEPTTEGTVTLKLQWGSQFTSSTGTTIASNIANSGSYTWDVPSDITDHSDYTVEIISDSDSDDNNYLPRFTVAGAEAAPSTTATSTSTTETTTTEETTTTTETSSTTTKTTMTTTTTDSSETPSPTSMVPTSSVTPAATTSTDSSSTSTDSTSSPSDSPTSVPTVNDDGDNAGMSNRVSGGLLALALGVAALV